MRVRFLVGMLVILAAASLAHAGDTHDIVAGKIADGIWNAKRAMNDIAALLSFGPRAPDMPGHEQALQYIEREMGKTKPASIKAQQWVDTAGTGLFRKLMGDSHPHSMANIVVRFYPEKTHRIIVGTHYDSIIRAYADKANPNAPMPGANNSASGVALLLETARALNHLPPPDVGIDFIFFDGEEGPLSLGAGDQNWHAIGSPYFADHLSDFYPDEKPQQAILFDMVCYRKMKLRPEIISLASAKNEVAKFWQTGAKYSSSVFTDEPYSYPIDDDQDALGRLGFPAFLVIGFEYDPYFNTTQDTIDKCSDANLKAVGNTLLDYIYSLSAQR